MLEVVEIEKEVKLFSKHVKTFSTLSLTPSVVRSFRYKKLEDVDFLFMRKASSMTQHIPCRRRLSIGGEQEWK